MSRRNLSEMEGAVLGLIWTNPATPYQVRCLLQRSPNPSWSGSAGAIYPLFRRLERRGLLDGRRVKSGEREGMLYSITTRGIVVLRRWIAPPFSRTTIGVPIDPLRTRARFLGLLPYGERKRFLGEAIANLRQHIAAIRADCRKRKASGDIFSYFTARGALLSCVSRLRWLVEILKAITERVEVNPSAGRTRTVRRQRGTGPMRTVPNSE